MTYVYDSVAGGNEGVGRLTSMTDQSGSTSFVYDALGNVVTQTKVINGVTYTSSYAYDTSNKLTQMTYPSGRIMTYGYDAEGRVNLVQTQVNAAGPIVTLSSNVTYKPFSRLVQNHNFSNGLNEWNNHDALYNINQLGLYDGGTLVDQRTMTRADSLNLTNIFHNGASSKDETIYYNNSGWIQNASGPYGNFTYYQDGVGNMSWRIRDVGGTVTTEQLGYPWNSNRVVDVTVGGVATRTFQYDAAGNITQDVRAGVGTYNYTYNNANRLSTVKLGTQDKGTYTYDGLSRLARRVVQNSGSANGNRQYIYDLYGNLIVEADDFGNTVREYIWFAQDIATSTLKTGVVPGFRPVAVVDDVDTTSPKLYHVHVDHVNRPVMMTDSTKAKVWDASYLPFGGVNTITGSASMNARFPGQWFQLESGLHYNWHRHYDATIARYTQPDPIGLDAGPSVYAYVTNSPHVYTDPKGLDVAIAVGSPTGFTGKGFGIGNPFGHVGIGIENNGTYSFGTGTKFGDNFTDYLADQSAYRDTTVFTLKTDAATDQCIKGALEKQSTQLPKPLSEAFNDNCSTRTASALKQCGIDIPIFNLPAGFVPWAIKRGASWTSVPKSVNQSTKIPKNFEKFNR